MRWETEVLIVVDHDRRSLIQRARRLAEWCATHASASLTDLAFTLNSDFDSHEARLSVIATSIADLEGKLRFAVSRLDAIDCQRINDRSGIFYYDEPPADRAKVAFLFPGEGAQYPNMLSDLCIHFFEVRACFDLLDRALQGQGITPSQFIFPPSNSNSDSSAAVEQLWQMNGAVEAVFTANRGLLALLEKLQIAPDVVLGHSTGEYNALMAAGAIRIDDEHELIENIRAGNSLSERLLSEGRIASGALLAVGPADETLIKSTLANMNSSVWLAMDNCPHQVVLYGSEAAIGELSNKLRSAGAVCQRLPFNRAYHTPLFAPVRDELESLFARLNFSRPRIAIYSCATARPYPTEPESIRKLVLDQWTSCVNFRQTINNLYEDGIRAFIEVGPRGNLTAFVKDVLRGKPHLALPANLAQRSGVTQINHMVARLAANRISVRPEHLYKGRHAQQLSLETETPSRPPAAAKPLSLSLPFVDGSALKRAATNGNHFQTTKQQTESSPVKSRAMQEYLRTMETFLETQQSVMQAFLSQGSHANVCAVAVSEPRPEVTANGNAGGAVPSVAINTESSHSLEDVLLEIVVDKTGYPREMLDLSASLEADLGIDSIKRVEILGAFQRQTNISGMDLESASRLKTLGQIIDLAARRSSKPANNAGDSINGAFIQNLDLFVPGKIARATKVFELKEDLFLKDHALGGRVSAVDPELCALVVIPLAISLECLAQVAALLASGKTLLTIRDVNAHRWLALEQPQVKVDITAEVSSNSPLEIHAKLAELTEGEVSTPAVEATFVFGDVRERPVASSFELSGSRPSAVSQEELYSHVMFHGPAFQGVVSIDKVGDEGIVATLRVPVDQHLFRTVKEAKFLTSAFLLDAVGQLVGFWTAQTLSERYVVFPFHIKRIECYGELPPAGSQLTGRAQMNSVTDGEIEADFEVVDANGLVNVRIEGWTDKRVDMPDDFFRFRMSPLREKLSQPCPNLSVDQSLISYSISLSDSLLRSERGIWRSVLAHLILSREERRSWSMLARSNNERTEWLLERVVAKDAARSFASEQWGVDLYPADIEILSDEQGRPFIKCDESLGRTLTLSLQHSDGTAVALVGARGT
jgi:malonyl CoA-acyl carrier protein transacylase/acyl carrier protein/phosphopantetheinyl transferase (holo-ACP synthase)